MHNTIQNWNAYLQKGCCDLLCHNLILTGVADPFSVNTNRGPKKEFSTVRWLLANVGSLR